MNKHVYHITICPVLESNQRPQVQLGTAVLINLYIENINSHT